MAFPTTSDCEQTYPMVLTRGEVVPSRVSFNAGPLLVLRSTTGGTTPTVQTDRAECFSIGQQVHLLSASKCDQLLLGSYAITGIGADTLALNWEFGDVVEETDRGWITLAQDLTGFSLQGYILTKNLNTPSIPGVTGCVAAGEDTVLLRNSSDIGVGDLVTLEGSGINQAKVLGVYTSGGTNSTTCGCNDASSGGMLSANSVLLLDQTASTTISCEAPGKVTRLPGILASLDFTLPTGASLEHGILDMTLTSENLASYPLPAGHCGNGAYLIGCYQIAMALGTLPSPRYPKLLPNWARVIAQGPAYLK